VVVLMFRVVSLGAEGEHSSTDQLHCGQTHPTHPQRFLRFISGTSKLLYDILGQMRSKMPDSRWAFDLFPCQA
jgi:hypothetical protein